MTAETELISLYCDKRRKLSKSHRDLDLNRTMPNGKLLLDILNILQFINLNHKKNCPIHLS